MRTARAEPAETVDTVGQAAVRGSLARRCPLPRSRPSCQDLAAAPLFILPKASAGLPGLPLLQRHGLSLEERLAFGS